MWSSFFVQDFMWSLSTWLMKNGMDN